MAGGRRHRHAVELGRDEVMKLHDGDVSVQRGADRPQRGLENLLVVAPRRKTLAQLAALELPGVDPSNLADFFRISPWDPDDLRLPLLEFIIRYLKGRNSEPARATMSSPSLSPSRISIDPPDISPVSTRLVSMRWRFTTCTTVPAAEYWIAVSGIATPQLSPVLISARPAVLTGSFRFPVLLR